MAHAETLADAIALAYQSNPNLQSDRAQLRALDETYVQARAGFGPTAQLGVVTDYQRAPSTDIFGVLQDTPTNDAQLSVSATQILYNGGRTAAQVEAAEASILAGREQLRATEASILVDVVEAYAAVIRDQDVFDIRNAALGVFQRFLTEAKARSDAGDATQTDVGQAQSQLASARADLAAARAQLQISRAAYTAVVGQNPGALAQAPVLPGLPATIDDAFTAAEQDNPGLMQAVMNEKVARERIRQARAGSLPTVTATASYGYTGPLDPLVPSQYNREIQGNVTVTQPLFASGTVISQVRQAVEQDTSARVQIEAARRTAVQSVSQAWNQLASAAEQTVANEDAVSAAQVSSEGARKEYQGALRSTLEVLIEEERLRDAQIALAEARYGSLASQAQLLSGMGRLEAAALMQPGMPLYDPVAHFRKVRNAGALPWEPVIAKLDGAASLGAGKLHAIPAPKPAAAPTGLQPAGGLPPAIYAETVPTQPMPDTAAPDPPARIDSAPAGTP